MEAHKCLCDAREPTRFVLASHSSMFELPQEPLEFVLMRKASIIWAAVAIWCALFMCIDQCLTVNKIFIL